MATNLAYSESSGAIRFGDAENLLRDIVRGRSFVFVTDEHVAACHSALFGDSEPLIAGCGEESKTMSAVEALWRGFMERGMDRTSLVVAVGGGIVTDIAGFAAATYMRGIEFGFVPSTLLAQVDASVGGKNGVNVDGYKNMVGTFTSPNFVIVDVSLLATLPEREFRAGIAEALKSGIIADEELFAILESHSVEELLLDKVLLEDVVRRALKVKMDIVSRDERESGERRLLNLGHTLAHAIEKCEPHMNHGEAVAVGVAAAARASVRLGMLGEADCRRISAALESLGFDLALPCDIGHLAAAAAKDKKGAGDKLFLVLPQAIGRCAVRLTPRAELAQLLAPEL